MRKNSRSVYVSLAHRYWNFGWERAQNHDVYGRLASPDGVGSNMRLDIEGDAEHDLGPGAERLKQLLDHRALFRDIDEFKTDASTLERITTYLMRHRDLVGWRSLIVHEDDRLSCAVTPAGDFRLRERVCNLTIESAAPIDSGSGVMVKRGRFARAVRNIAPRFAGPTPGGPVAFAERVLEALREAEPSISALEVCLNPRDSVRVSITTKGEVSCVNVL